MKRLRNWCAQARFSPEHDTFLFGTVQASTELEAERILRSEWRKMCPHPVEILAVIPGLLAFEAEP